MITFTRHTLGKLEDLFSEQTYTIRYEKGSFQSGYCMVEEKKVIVINRFFDVEARINTFLDILPQITMEEELFSEKSAKFYREVMKEISKNEK